MQKIIAAFDGLKYSPATAAYAVEVARKNKAHLVAVFLEDFTYHSYKIYDLVSDEGIEEEKQVRLEERDKAVRLEAVRTFEKLCAASQVEYTVHRDRNIAIQELIRESIYADLLVISCAETLGHYEENPPTYFIRTLMADVQCPVLLVPEHFHAPDKVIVLYDGSPTSVFAIKEFSYVMPALKKLDVLILTVKEEHENKQIPDNKLAKELVNRHFPNAKYKTLAGDPEAEIVRYLKSEMQNPLVVVGAYGRSRVSRWFKSSMADVLMEEVSMPIFVTHRK